LWDVLYIACYTGLLGLYLMCVIRVESYFVGYLTLRARKVKW